MPLTILPTPRSLLDRVGQEIAVSDWFPITQERIQTFAEVTGDLQWIHLDPERARQESPFGTTIAHGFLTLSLLTYLLTASLKIEPEPGMVVNYGFNRVRFPAPVPSGASLRGRFTVQTVKELPDALEITYTATMERQGSPKPCCIAEWILRYYA